MHILLANLIPNKNMKLSFHSSLSLNIFFHQNNELSAISLHKLFYRFFQVLLSQLEQPPLNRWRFFFVRVLWYLKIPFNCLSWFHDLMQETKKSLYSPAQDENNFQLGHYVQ